LTKGENTEDISGAALKMKSGSEDITGMEEKGFHGEREKKSNMTFTLIGSRNEANGYRLLPASTDRVCRVKVAFEF